MSAASKIPRMTSEGPLATLRAALRIITDVAVFRLRRLEMANLAGAAAVAIAVALPPLEIAGRLGFGALLNLLVYLNNDFLDLDADLAAPSREARMTRFLAAHRRAAIVAQLGLLALAAAVALAFEPSLLAPLLAGGGLCWAYSAWLKRRPGVDVAAMILWGVAMSSVGAPLGDPLAWALVIQLGLFSGVFEAIQVLRDRPEDQRAGVRTTAVVLGERGTKALIRVLLVLAGAYAALVIHPALAALPLVGVLLPIDAAAIPGYWTRIRGLLGVALIAAVAWVVIHGGTAGLWLRISRATVT
ncbi:MAG: UbiA family prenyltransferase [Nannocystaceae bacterium]